jgi:hypothetical protein
MSPLTPEQRIQRARLGGLATSAANDPKSYTESARRAFLNRFVDQVDPHRELSEDERNRRALAARKLHMQKLAWASGQARRKAASR